MVHCIGGSADNPLPSKAITTLDQHYYSGTPLTNTTFYGVRFLEIQPKDYRSSKANTTLGQHYSGPALLWPTLTSANTHPMVHGFGGSADDYSCLWPFVVMVCSFGSSVFMALCSFCVPLVASGSYGLCSVGPSVPKFAQAVLTDVFFFCFAYL